MSNTDTPNVKEAKSIIQGRTKSAKEMFDLGKALKSERAFSFARRVLERALDDRALDKDPPLKILVHQQCALCTYKDEDLSARERYDLALEVLDEIDDFGDTVKEKQETMGLYGAIYKRKWEVDAQKLNLERSLLYYRRGYELGVKTDQGYTAINAAYALELLAYQEAAEKLDDPRLVTSGGGESAGATAADTAALRRAEADRIRKEIIAEVPALVGDPAGPYDWWPIVTVAEAHFGLGRYEQAEEWLMKAADLHDKLKVLNLGFSDWEWESTLRQFASLARMKAGATADAAEMRKPSEVLSKFMQRKFGPGGDTTAAVRTAFLGKMGLGLSGGGFRASIFHIGVLAKLAELDLLRRVEVLSCVSGGSIIGAHYYLEVRKLLQTKTDEEITREDYIDIVQRIERDFLAGVQRNIRTRIIAEWWTNVKLFFRRTYTRTNRAGELYESELFARVQDGEGKDANGRCLPRWFNDLYVKPAGESPSFHPKYDNWRRSAKAPILSINATTLNTGHNWQFTASWMGEPPVAIKTDVDASDRLRRMYYWQAKAAGKDKVRLGDAVSASACVPGLFEPLVIENLYVRKTAGGASAGGANEGDELVTVRLVDGGVQDNQGITALLEQDCNVLLVSDASGQMASVKDPKTGFVGRMLGGVLGVLLRSKDILMARVREAEYEDLVARRRSMQLRGLMYIHLTKGLGTQPVDWLYCDDPSPAPSPGGLTEFDVRKDVQRLLADIRTDLDSFSDAESYALMLSGYRMTEYELEQRRVVEGLPQSTEPAPNWRFLTVDDRLKTASADPKSEYQSLVKQLRVASQVAFKIWRLRRVLQIFAAALALFVIGVAGYGVFSVLTSKELGDRPIIKFSQLVWALLTMIAIMLGSLILGSVLMKVARYQKTLTRALVHLGMSIFGFLVARLHLHVFDWMYLRMGSVPLNPTVFFCYAHEDERFAAKLDAEFRAKGHRTSIDGKECLYSPEREKEIHALINQAQTFVFVASQKSQDSKVCGALLEYARGKGRKIVNVLTPGFNYAGGQGQKSVAFSTNGSGPLEPAALQALLQEVGDAVALKK
ncbi:MAG TPA: tetratricopeptide repeat-containing protein [Pyrinomonadaceae bacterium]|jgi:predicted acylesterase/phospholipase RssA/tetratricopeptide (TPR) repeat protein